MKDRVVCAVRESPSQAIFHHNSCSLSARQLKLNLNRKHAACLDLAMKRFAVLDGALAHRWYGFMFTQTGMFLYHGTTD